MAFQTRDEAQDKVSRKLDRVLNKKKKHVPLSQESWDDLYRRGATLVEQEQWLVLKRRQRNETQITKHNFEGHSPSFIFMA